MARLLVHVEGYTEELFVREVLRPYLFDHGYSVVGAWTLGRRRSRNRRGGVTPWVSARRDILSHLKQDQGLVVTTMVDYYGLPQTWPGRAEAPQQAFANRAATVESMISKDVIAELGPNFNPRRLVPYIVMHEFEGLLFSDPVRFAQSIGKPDLAARFQAIRNEFATPEEINDSAITAPSKRVRDLFAGYEKPLMGTLAAIDVGLESIRRECAGFRSWMERLEQLP